MADPRPDQEIHKINLKFIIQKIRKLPEISRDVTKEIRSRSKWYSLSINTIITVID